jgi:hypothetical protein
MRPLSAPICAAVLGLAVPALLSIGACTKETPEPKPVETDIPEEVARTLGAAPQAVAQEAGTPLAQRVATLGLLNKRNNISEDIVLKPGEARRIGNVVVKLASCERTAPWENPPETGAFVQVLVNERDRVDQPLRWRRVFSGWLFKNTPSLNVVEHPIYDVWVKDCAMKFPGEEPAAAANDSKAE